MRLARGKLHPSDVVVAAARSGTESYRYPDPPAGGRWTTSVSGDTAVISIEHPATGGALPVDAEPELDIRVDRVTRGFTAAEASARRSQRTESICGGSDDSRDAVCYRSSQPVAYRNARAVARLLIDGTQLCTAWRVGPRNRMLTNNHCVADAEQLRVTEVWFDYECFDCGGSAPRRPVKVGGADLLATDAALDFTLFTVDEIEAVAGFGFLTLDMRRPQRGEELYIPQHPRGAPTAIAMSDPQEAEATA